MIRDRARSPCRCSHIARRILGIDTVGKFLVRRKIGVIQRHAAIIVPKVGGVVVVGNALAVVTEEAIEALLKRLARGAGVAEPPLAESAGGVTLLLEKLCNGDRVGGDGILSFRLHLAVTADKGVSGMLASHQYAA